ncbi:MAG TPA: hypothetical protein VL442_04765 [Mucilaginibacter sp.]|jgi:hypothetical protein|nr:hypothetical protein [Mucilaginibacter sp.]
MRVILIIVFAMLSLGSCKRKDNSSAAKKSDTNAKIGTVKKMHGVLSASNVITVSTDFPNDTIYPARILTSGGVFHEDEVDPKSSTYKWKGIFKSGSGYYINDTELKLSRDHDAIMDDDGKKTGWMITTSIKDTSILLISGLDYLQDRQVSQIKLSKDQLLPGEKEQFTYKDVIYTLYATGDKKLEKPGNKDFIVSNYRLFLKAAGNGQSYNQLLVSVSNFDGTITSILFAGDIDCDNIPDFIIDTTNNYDAEAPTLYLSKPASNGKLLKVMGKHIAVGC